LPVRPPDAITASVPASIDIDIDIAVGGLGEAGPLDRRGGAGPTYLFGAFRLIPDQHLLLRDDTPVRLGGRALDILTLLVDRAGCLVTKKELMAHAWPHTVVEECNVKVTVAVLRNAIGDGEDGHRYLVNIPRQGYKFVAPVARLAAPAPVAGSSPRRPHGVSRTATVAGAWCPRFRPSRRAL